MINKDAYLKEVESLVKNQNGNREDLIVFLAVVMEEENLKIDRVYLAEKIIKELFSNPYSEGIMVPWEFFNTEVGKAIIKAKFGLEEERIYFVKDLVELTGKSRAWIGQEAINGNIKSEKRGTKVIFRESDVNKYLKERGYKTIEEIQKQAYEEVMQSLEKKEFKGGGYEREVEYKTE